MLSKPTRQPILDFGLLPEVRVHMCRAAAAVGASTTLHATPVNRDGRIEAQAAQHPLHASTHALHSLKYLPTLLV